MTISADTFYQNIDASLIDLALHEDLGPDNIDCTNRCFFVQHQEINAAQLISKQAEPIVFCGFHLIPEIFKRLKTECRIETKYKDGDVIAANTRIAKIHANIAGLLTAERTILNFIRHLSAIATLTKQFVDKVKHTSMKILDTRKTTPGMRHLEKHAVRCGGGINHRMGLYDVIMVKDTHIDLLGGIENMLNVLAKSECRDKPIIIEIRNQYELSKVLQQNKVPIHRVLLDNMTIDELAQCVKFAKEKNIATEASGNITLSNVLAIAETGVDYASIGRLTHSAGQVDLAMII